MGPRWLPFTEYEASGILLWSLICHSAACATNWENAGSDEPQTLQCFLLLVLSDEHQYIIKMFCLLFWEQ